MQNSTTGRCSASYQQPLTVSITSLNNEESVLCGNTIFPARGNITQSRSFKARHNEYILINLSRDFSSFDLDSSVAQRVDPASINA